MQFNKDEIAVVEKAVVETNEAVVRELSELQMAFVGGGCADPIAH
jgi:hypothetical protein